MSKTQTHTVIIKRHYDAHPRVQFIPSGVSRTHQSMAEECDINTIMAKYQKTGIIDHRNNFEGQYGDFTDTPQDYHESMNAVIAANDMFETLPSSVRKKFANDAGLFLDFVGDPKNAAEMVQMGLATAAQLDEPDPVLIEPKPAPKEPKTEPTDPPK